MILGLVFTLALAGAVVGVVTWQARRSGRQVLSEQGRERVQAARERTGEVAGQARSRVADLSRDGDSRR
ncbi:MAG: hypothetical protein ACRC0L_12645 [Angustibacter sp.]